MVVIPKASRQEHVREDLGTLDLKLTDADLADLDRSFPPPKGRTALGML
jgi:diketogulonate reductase-like aldo/keto reductase